MIPQLTPLSAAREVALTKPIVLIKGGRTDEAARALAESDSMVNEYKLEMIRPLLLEATLVTEDAPPPPPTVTPEPEPEPEPERPEEAAPEGDMPALEPAVEEAAEAVEEMPALESEAPAEEDTQ